MKMITAIVNKEDTGSVCRALTEAGFSFTKLATTGGFLRAGNTTLIIGVDDEKMNNVMEIIEKVCKSRKQIATAPSPISGSTGVYVPYPIEVTAGGATVFVVDVEQFHKF